MSYSSFGRSRWPRPSDPPELTPDGEHETAFGASFDDGTRANAFPSISRLVREADERRQRDAQRFADIDHDLCMLCGAYGADKRSLFIDCFYAVHEVVPEAIDLYDVKPRLERGHGYYLLICKSCRGRLLSALAAWRAECVALLGKPKDHDGYLDDCEDGKNVPVRVNGITVMMDDADYATYCDQNP